MLRLVDKQGGGGRFNNLTLDLGLMLILRCISHVFVGIFIVTLTTLHIVYIIYIPGYLFYLKPQAI